MIVDSQIKALVAQIEREPATSDAAVSLLVLKLTEACADPDNRRRYQADNRQPSAVGSYPIGADGYAVGFDPLEDERGFVDAWQRYGFVVGKGIVSSAQCQKTMDGIKARFNALSSGQCDLDKPETWNNIPKDENGTSFVSRGFLEIYHDDILAQVRQNVRAYIHNVLIWGRADLWTSFDRIGVKLPHHEESKALPLHVDQNPNVHPDFKTVQGVLALTDCPVERGTFLAVPGSRACFSHYAAMAKNSGEYVELDTNTEIAKVFQTYAQPIPLRAGDFVSWDSRTTHANTENISNDMRMVVYMAAGPAQEDNPDALAARMDALKTGLGSNVREALMHASKKPRYTNADALARIRQPEQLTLMGKLLYGTERYKKITPPPAA